jgi:mono/diheme cytochrome c family protein
MFYQRKHMVWLICILACVCMGVIAYIVTHAPDASESAQRYGFGRAARSEEIRRLNIDVRPDGSGLPAGSGMAKSGLLIYKEKCLACHGNGETSAIKLPGGELFSRRPTDKVKTIGNYWPCATTIFDYVRRAMPYNAPGSLTDQEVYHLTAYLLFVNGIIQEDFVVDQGTLPGIVMPATAKFVDDDRQGGNQLR